MLLAAVTAVALYFLTFIAWNWQGGGGFVGNRYFVTAIPAFLFLVTEIRPPRLLLAGYVVAGLFLAPLLFTPFGATVPEPTLQAHVRGLPFRFLPLELSLRNVPGYERIRSATCGSWGGRTSSCRRGSRCGWAAQPGGALLHRRRIRSRGRSSR